MPNVAPALRASDADMADAMAKAYAERDVRLAQALTRLAALSRGAVKVQEALAQHSPRPTGNFTISREEWDRIFFALTAMLRGDA